MKRVLLFAILILLGTGVSFAGKSSDDSSSDWQSSDLGRSLFGEQWSGPSMPQDQLEGKVVWVTILKSSTSDAKSLKDMATIDQQFRRKGVVMIGVHYFMTTRDKCMDNVKRAGAKFPVFQSARIQWKGRDREGVTKTNNRFYLPYSVMYGPDGMILWEGKCPPAASKIASYIQMGLKKMPKNAKAGDDEEDDEAADLEAILDGVETDKIKDIESLVKSGKIGPAIAKCEIAKDSKGDRASQATELLGRLNVYASSCMSRAKQQRKILPSKAVAKLTDVKKQFAGTPYAKEADEMLAKYKQDKEFQADLAAEKTYLPIVKYAAEIPEPEKGCDYDAWQKKNSRRMQTLQKKVDAFKEKNSDSMFCKRLDDLVKSFDEKVSKDEDEDEDKGKTKKDDGDDDSDDSGDDDTKTKEKVKDKGKNEKSDEDVDDQETIDDDDKIKDEDKKTSDVNKSAKPTKFEIAMKNREWQASEGKLFTVEATNNAKSPVETGIHLKKGQKFVLLPNPVDQWCGGGSMKNKLTGYEGYPNKASGWMKMFFKVKDAATPVTGGSHIAASNGELVFYCEDGQARDNKGKIRIKVEIESGDESDE